MHAARAIQANRQKVVKEDVKLKVETRRPSASSSRIPRSPAVSIDTKKVQPHHDDSDNLNFSYAGFLIAVFGAVPLLVGTFVEVPALWEIGLGVTLVGLFIGVVFWCTELCAEAKKFSQKKNKLSTRGKIEDSNLLHVPERKFHNGNGVESRRSSFQSDSVSLITPMAQSFGSPKHLAQLGSNSILQYYASDYSKSDDSSATLSSSLRANGHLGLQHPPPPPKLLLRGTRKDDSRVVSLVQPDPGLEDESDSDAETVIEAPTGKPKIIQVQTLQEKVRRQSNPYPRDPGLVLSVSGHSLMDPDTDYHVEDETVPPLVPLAQQHRTIRMPVMPQEVDKLQKCECGRYLLTERDKLVGVRMHEGGGSSMPVTAYNSPNLAGTVVSGAGTAPATRRLFSRESFGVCTPDSSSTSSSVNDIPSTNTTPSTDDNKVISSAVHSFPHEGGKVTGRQKSASSTGSRRSCGSSYNEKSNTIKSAPTPHPNKSGSVLTRGESVVQVEPPISSADLLGNGKKTECDECDGSPEDDGEDEMGSGDPIESISPGGNSSSLLETRRIEPTSSVEDKDRVLEELLELTDVSNDSDDAKEEGLLPRQRSSETQTLEEDNENEGRQQIGNQQEADHDDDDDEEFQIPSKPHPPQPEMRREGQSRSNSASRPTSLALPVIQSDSRVMTHQSKTDESEPGLGLIKSTASSASSASTVVFIGEQSQTPQSTQVEAESERQGGGSEKSDMASLAGPALSKEMSLDELLDKLEKNEDGDVLAVVVQ